MGSGIKSHQDTVLHPMYVSYNSLPTSGGTLRQNHTAASVFRTKRLVGGTVGGPRGLECQKNFVNFNGKENLLQEIGNQKRQSEDTLADLPNYFPPNPIGMHMTGPRKQVNRRVLPQRKSMVEGDVSFYTGSEPVDDLIDLQPSSSGQQRHRAAAVVADEHLPEYNTYNRANILVNQRLKHDGFYKMPVDFIPRSPNLSASGRRRNQNALKNMNFCDQIRSPPAAVQPTTSHHHQGTASQHSRTSSYSQLPVGVGNFGEKFLVDREVHPEENLWSPERGDVQQKMNQMLGKKKSLRPRSFCSSNYYEFDPVTDPRNRVPVPNT